MRNLTTSFALLLCCAASSSALAEDVLWSAVQLDQLRTFIAQAPEEGLNVAGLQVVTPQSATDVALTLARAHLHGCTPAQARAGWHIKSNDDQYDLPLLLREALARNDLPDFFERLRPRHPDYAALRTALRVETDPARRATLIRNLERWRWMPLDLGARYLLVNAPRFEVALWEKGARVQSWRVIVGKPSTPTPVFSAIVTGATYNPWWDVPQSIVAESVGRLVRTRPAEARRRGYVWGSGSYRQRPGPNNPLGQVKLVMPNPYSVYLHDTNAKALFEKPVRTFSHGCIRVDNAVVFVSFLFRKNRLAEAAGKTVSFPLEAPLPVYVSYFTASVGTTGLVEFHPDIYGRDARMGDARNPVKDCPA